MKDITKKYTKGDLTIVWKPNVCVHSAICFKGLPSVFDPAQRPWITPENSDTENIKSQIDKCPSGALTYEINVSETLNLAIPVESKVEVSKNGPLLVYGDLIVKDSDGNETKRKRVTAFCRCGASSNKPYCDATHKKIEFVG